MLNKALHGCVQSALLWHKLFSTTLVLLGFELNPYGFCAANADIDGSQCATCWHVEDNKISHADPAVMTKIIEALGLKFGKFSVTRGRKHDFLGTMLTLHENGQLETDVKDAC